MSIKGFPSQQKRVNGQNSRADFATVQPSFDYRNQIDVIPRFAYRVGAIRTAQAGTGNLEDNSGTYIADTATTARVGDFVRFETGSMAGLEVAIVEVETNGFRLAARVESSYAPAATNTFYIMRYSTQQVSSDGTAIVTVTPSPVQYVLDGVDTEVLKDTVTPANNKALPVTLEPARAGSFAEITNLTTAAQTFVAPAKATGFKLQAPSSNTVNLRWKIGATATITSGFLMEPGRSEDFDCVGTISIITESGTGQHAYVQWKVES